jgi:hypothetical protein
MLDFNSIIKVYINNTLVKMFLAKPTRLKMIKIARSKKDPNFIFNDYVDLKFDTSPSFRIK